MHSPSIVEALNVSEQIHPGFSQILIFARVDALGLDR